MPVLFLRWVGAFLVLAATFDRDTQPTDGTFPGKIPKEGKEFFLPEALAMQSAEWDGTFRTMLDAARRRCFRSLFDCMQGRVEPRTGYPIQQEL